MSGRSRYFRGEPEREPERCPECGNLLRGQRRRGATLMLTAHDAEAAGLLPPEALDKDGNVRPEWRERAAQIKARQRS